MTVFALYNMKGGVGKSTTAVNLAYLSAASGARTLLWDLDAQAASSFAFRVNPKVEGFGKKSLERVDTLTDAIKATDYDNLDLLPADFAYRKLDRFLERLARPQRGLSQALEEIGRGYTHVFLDCPPGFSLLTENVWRAANVVLAPTIPTVLSLRTLARLVTSLEGRAKGAKLFAFLSMVDRRKALHRGISEWAAGHCDFFLPAQVPYASVVEQMSVRRMPVSVVAPRDPAALAFDALWREALARVARPSGPTPDPRRCAAFVQSIGELIAVLGGEDASIPVPDEEADALPSSPSPRDARRARVRRFGFVARGESDFESLMRQLSVDAPSPVPQLAHIFDTEKGDLLRSGYLVQLLEEPGRFTVAAEALGSPRDPASSGEPALSAQIDGGWAATILSGQLSPLTVLERRLRRPLPKLMSALTAAVGNRPVQRTTWRKHIRRYLGPIVVPFERTAFTLLFEFDRVSTQEGQVAHQIEVSVEGANAHEGERALRQLFSRAGVDWLPSTNDVS